MFFIVVENVIQAVNLSAYLQQLGFILSQTLHLQRFHLITASKVLKLEY